VASQKRSSFSICRLSRVCASVSLPPPRISSSYFLASSALPARRTGDGGEVPAQPLCARLTDMQLSENSAYRGNVISSQVSGEHNGGALPKRIGHGAIVMRGVQLPAPRRR